MPLTASGIRVMMRHLAEVRATPLDSIHVHPSEDLSLLRFDLDGPEGTPFSEGRFLVTLSFDEHYPEIPPKAHFRNKIFHPNVSERGEICVNALQKDWAPHLGLPRVLLVIRCLLVEPNPASALNEEAGRLLREDYAAYERKARMFTRLYAQRPAGVPRLNYPPRKEEPLPSRSTEAPVRALADPNNWGKGRGTSEDCASNPQDESATHRATTMTTRATISGDGSLPGEFDTESSHPLRSLEGNNAYFASGKVKDDDLKTGSVNVMVRGAGVHGEAGCNKSSMIELHASKAAQKKIIDKKKAALRRI
ncbi:unnamed protein product [Phytomonas sp. Hart1]|nr:unnamed protein product [Phytomonas sp. Hart1]|eukprot:CCW69337.1 unnamed protein product [Phytomonas sp. isolate Hart1]